MGYGEVGRQFKEKSGNVECNDLRINGTLSLSQGKIKLVDTAGRLGQPASLTILDSEGVPILKLIVSNGNLEIRGNVVKQQ